MVGEDGMSADQAAPAERRSPYSIPPVAEILASPRNGLVAVSTFSGCGGSCLGLRWAGWRVAWANEFLPNAAASYRANFPDTPLDGRDIRSVSANDILAATGIGEGGIDLLEGSPPCSDFSMAGRREKGWGKERAHGDGSFGRSDDLFMEWLRLADELRPRALWAENVVGLTRGVARGLFNDVMRRVRSLGYRAKAAILDASRFGVPQERRRVFVVGVREDLGADPAFPDPCPWRYSVRDALPWIGRAEIFARGDDSFRGGMRTLDGCAPTVCASSPDGMELRAVLDDGYGPAVDITNRPCPTVRASRSSMLKVEPEAALRGRIANEWGGLRPGETHPEIYTLRKADPDAPSPTIAASWGTSGSMAQTVHPFERRRFSIAELRRICGFPDDFALAGSFAQQWARLGNSVAPPVARALGARLAGILLSARRDGEPGGP